MPLTNEEYLALEKKARELRKLTIDTVMWANGGHIGGALSSVDILTVLYYKQMNIRVDEPEWEDRDRFVLSKGHIGVGFAPVLADKGFFDKDMLKTYNHTHSKLGMHLDVNKVVGLDASTGSLGHGLSLALGMSLGGRLQGKKFTVYCLLGDGECDEGQVWEAAMAVSHYKATNVIPIIDRNRCMIDGPTEEVMALEPFAEKWKAFGFDVMEIDGHNVNEINDAIEKAKTATERPIAIIANTYKGCGVKMMQDNYKYHYASVDAELGDQCKADIDEYHDQRLKN